jgi:hypothetical protein
VQKKEMPGELPEARASGIRQANPLYLLPNFYVQPRSKKTKVALEWETPSNQSKM